ILVAQNRFADALAAYRASLVGFKALAARQPDFGPLRDQVRENAEKIGGVAYSLVLAGDFATALEAADEALAVASHMIFIHGNRAHALMLLGRVDEARAVYLKYRGQEKVVGDKRWEVTVLEDFAEMRKAGLTHPLMGEIEKLFAPKG